MMRSRRQNLPAALLGCLAFLLCLAGNASAAFDHSSQNIASGDFFWAADYASENPPEPLINSRERVHCGWKTASDALEGPNEYTFVRQNPWSAFDPHGLDMKKAGEKLDSALYNLSQIFNDPGRAMEAGADLIEAGLETGASTLDMSGKIALRLVSTNPEAPAVTHQGIRMTSPELSDEQVAAQAQAQHALLDAVSSKRSRSMRPQKPPVVMPTKGKPSSTGSTARSVNIATKKYFDTVEARATDSKGNYLGGASGKYDSRSATLHVEMIGVQPAAQKQGVSTQLYKSMIKESGNVDHVTGVAGGSNAKVLRDGGSINDTPRAKSLSKLGFTKHKYDPDTKEMTSSRESND